MNRITATVKRAVSGALLASSVIVGLAAVPTTPAAATPGQAAVVRCWTITPTRLSGDRYVLRIGSSNPTTANVHTFRVQWHSGVPFNTTKWITYSQKPRNFVTPAMKGWRIDVVEGQQARSACARWTR